jgi:hypothetical protein
MLFFISYSLNLKVCYCAGYCRSYGEFFKKRITIPWVRISSQHVSCNLEELPSDSGKRPKMSTYHPYDQEIMRRAYLQRGPCQPNQHNFLQRKIENSMRRICPSWFNEFGNWLEYSIEKDAAFYLCCYLFILREMWRTRLMMSWLFNDFRTCNLVGDICKEWMELFDYIVNLIQCNFLDTFIILL